MKQTRIARRREAAINSVKILLTSASLAATVGGWAVISTANGAAVDVAQVNSTAIVQAFLDSRSTATVGSTAEPAASATAASTSAARTNTVTNARNNTLPAATTTTAPTATVAATATATAVPTQVVVQRIIRTRSSR